MRTLHTIFVAIASLAFSGCGTDEATTPPDTNVASFSVGGIWTLSTNDKVIQKVSATTVSVPANTVVTFTSTSGQYDKVEILGGSGCVGIMMVSDAPSTGIFVENFSTNNVPGSCNASLYLKPAPAPADAMVTVETR